jgi:hypothetical protein
MRPDALYGPFKVVAWLVLVLLLVAAIYAAAMSVHDWSGIGV